MMKTCKTVLTCARKLYSKQQHYPTMEELARATGLNFDEVIASCRELKQNGFLEYTYRVDSKGKSDVVAGITLNIKGQKPKEYVLDSLLNYLKKNLVAIIALIISIAAFIKSFFG